MNTNDRAILYDREHLNYANFYNVLLNKRSVPGIKKVIFNNPATIVLWLDGTKTVVKVGDFDVFDVEKGLAMAIAKRALGNNGNYYKEFKKWIDLYNKNYCKCIVDKQNKIETKTPKWNWYFEFYKRLKDRMGECAIDSKELAHQIGFTEGTVRKYLNQSSWPTEKTINKIAEALGVLPEYFIEEDYGKNSEED